MDDRNNWNDLQSNFCSVLIVSSSDETAVAGTDCYSQSIVRKFGHGINPRADRIMTLILQLISLVGKVSTVLEDAFLVVGTLASSLEQDFEPYITAFLQFLFPALKAHEDSQLCTIAVGIIGDISRALGEKTKEYSAGFMQLLSENLQSNTLNRDAKVPILECFGDIALAIGPAFEGYLDHTMNVLRQAGSITPNPVSTPTDIQRKTLTLLPSKLDYELQDYLSILREGILEAYTGIVTAFKGTDQGMPSIQPMKRVAQSGLVRLLQPHIQDILELVKAALLDESHGDPVYGLAYGIIGDLAEIFGPQIKPLLLQDWVAAELKSRRCPQENKQTMRWAREVCCSELSLYLSNNFYFCLDGQTCHSVSIALQFLFSFEPRFFFFLTILTLLVQPSQSRNFFLPWVRYTFFRVLCS
jgi:importin subunit beta-1